MVNQLYNVEVNKVHVREKSEQDLIFCSLFLVDMVQFLVWYDFSLIPSFYTQIKRLNTIERYLNKQDRFTTCFKT